jgi:cell division protein FtsN
VARAATPQRRRRSRRRSGAGLPRGFAMGIVLLVCTGLVAWYFRGALDGIGPAPEATTGESPAPASKPGTKPAQKAGQKPGPASPPEGPAAEADDRFEFYEVLPDAEVDVPEQPARTEPATPAPVSVPGTYVIQAGSFPDFAEADKVKARLALLGIVSEIQTADVSGRRFHRVRVGPIDDLGELNRLRARLRQNGIESIVNAVGE